MALRDITNVSPVYIPKVTLESKYAPLIRRGKVLEEQVCRSTFSARRLAGDYNIDLWCNGSIYPTDPSSGFHPNFHTLKEYLQFVCHGENGMLGYTKRLKLSCAGGSQCQGAQVVAEIRTRMVASESRVQRLELACRELHMEVVATRTSSSQVIQERDQLVATVNLHESALAELRGKLLERSEELLIQERQHKRYKDECQQLQNKMKSLVNTPFGWRQRQSKGLKSLAELSVNSGHAKQRTTMLRAQLHPGVVGSVQQSNRLAGCKKRLSGGADTQQMTARALAKLLSSTEANALVDQPELGSAGTRVAKRLLKEIGDSIGPEDILQACDVAGVAHQGYGEIYKSVKGRISLVNSDLKSTLLPAPNRIATLRKEMNAKLPQFIGDYYHIEGRMMLAASKRGQTITSAKEVVLNDKNTLFVDLEVVQRSMVMFYGMTEAECNGKPLIFVLKLDEAEVQNGKKFERVSITLMNRALDPEIQKTSDRYFSVQSEQEIWPVACFQVEKESHEVLDWVFRRTKFPDVIEAQTSGQKLVVPDIGEFEVEWHLSADMKTIKCMYGLKHGPSSKMNCIYCEQERSKPVVGTAANTSQAVAGRAKGRWQGGLFASRIRAEPCDVSTHTRWKPILPIPLSRVHICTLHAQVRMIEKMLHMHFVFVWNMQGEERRNNAIDLMEKCLSAIGVQGGNCQLKKDPKLSGATGNVPQKPSLSGVVASRLFQPSSWSGKDKAWKDVCIAEQNNLERGLSRQRRYDMWEAFEDLQPYLTGLVLTIEQRQMCKEKVEKWGKSYLAAFGEEHVTHYMHVFVKHAPWFVDKYGSLSVWSCQGMEKSHHAAKAANQAHTQHGGTKAHTSAIVQQYQHWYRNIQHRYARKIANEAAAELLRESMNSGSIESSLAAKRARRESWMASTAATAHSEWRSTCQRLGSIWVPQHLDTRLSAHTDFIDNTSNADEDDNNV